MQLSNEWVLWPNGQWLWSSLHLALPLPFPNNCLSSSLDSHGASTCGGLGTPWQHAGQSYGETGVWFWNSALSIST